MPIKVYTSPTCVYCHALLDWLDERGIKYEELDAAKAGFSSVPVTEIGDEIVLGFNRRKIKKLLSQNKSPES